MARVAKQKASLSSSAKALSLGVAEKLQEQTTNHGNVQ